MAHASSGATMGSYPRSRLLYSGSKYRLMSNMRTLNVVSLNFLPSAAPRDSQKYPSGYMNDQPGNGNLRNSDVALGKMSTIARSMNFHKFTGAPSVQM